MRHTISILLENEPGALSRVAGLFSARGYNIESLTVAPTEDSSMSRMTLVTRGSDEVIEQITKQLNKLVDVIKLLDLTEGTHIERELMMVKLSVPTPNQRDEITRLVNIFRGQIIDVGDINYTIEMTGPGDKLDAFLKAVEKAIEPELIMEVVRSGVLGIARGNKSLRI
jgi:acetolactate synthase-1/3 small subunit